MKKRGIFGIFQIIFGVMNMLVHVYWKDEFGGLGAGDILLSICFIWLGIYFIVEWRKNPNGELLTEEEDSTDTN